MSLQKNVNGAWVDVENLKRYENGAWVDCESAKKYVNGAWEEVWSSVVIIDTLDDSYFDKENVFIQTGAGYFEIEEYPYKTSSSTNYIDLIVIGDFENPVLTFDYMNWLYSEDIKYESNLGNIFFWFYTSETATSEDKQASVGTNQVDDYTECTFSLSGSFKKIVIHFKWSTTKGSKYNGGDGMFGIGHLKINGKGYDFSNALDMDY